MVGCIRKMKTDYIVEVKIDEQNRLYLKIEKESFPLIYRESAGVNWDQSNRYLYSTPPREWSYVKWYKHICNLAYQGGCTLILSSNIEWTNVADELREEILGLSS